MAFLYINSLKLTTLIGCLEWEQRRRQDILIDIRIEMDAQPAAASDRLADTIDYAGLAAQITTSVENSSYQLIEKLACSVMDIIFQNPLTRSARVRVHKPGAIANAQSAAVEISR